MRVFSDADVAQQQSITGFVHMLGPNSIDWKSRKQTLVTTEAEIVAMSEATEDLEWKLVLRKEMTNMSGSVTLLTDCQSGIKKLKRGEAGGRTKHLDLRAQAVADRMERKPICLQYVPTEDNVADMLTKRLGFLKYSTFVPHRSYVIVNNQPYQIWLMFRRKRVFSGADGLTSQLRF